MIKFYKPGTKDLIDTARESAQAMLKTINEKNSILVAPVNPAVSSALTLKIARDENDVITKLTQQCIDAIFSTLMISL